MWSPNFVWFDIMTRSDKEREKVYILAVICVIEQYAHSLASVFVSIYLIFGTNSWRFPSFSDLFADENFLIRSRQIDVQKENVGEKERRL